MKYDDPFPIRKEYLLHDILVNFHRLFTCRIFGHSLSMYGGQYEDEPSKFYHAEACFRCCLFPRLYWKTKEKEGIS